MKRIALKPVSIALCAALLIGSSAGITALAVKNSESDAKTTAADTDTKVVDTEKEEEKKNGKRMVPLVSLARFNHRHSHISHHRTFSPAGR